MLATNTSGIIAILLSVWNVHISLGVVHVYTYMYILTFVTLRVILEMYEASWLVHSLAHVHYIWVSCVNWMSRVMPPEISIVTCLLPPSMSDFSLLIYLYEKTMAFPLFTIKGKLTVKVKKYLTSENIYKGLCGCLSQYGKQGNRKEYVFSVLGLVYRSIYMWVIP